MSDALVLVPLGVLALNLVVFAVVVWKLPTLKRKPATSAPNELRVSRRAIVEGASIERYEDVETNEFVYRIATTNE